MFKYIKKLRIWLTLMFISLFVFFTGCTDASYSSKILTVSEISSSERKKEANDGSIEEAVETIEKNGGPTGKSGSLTEETGGPTGKTDNSIENVGDSTEEELADTPSSMPNNMAEPEVKEYSSADLNNLRNLDYFKDSTIEHIFLGTINKKGNATGYHYEMIADSPGHIIGGTESEPDEYGVYSAKVAVSDTKKDSNGGYSSFFPKNYSPQDVIDAINEAYENAELVPGSDYIYQGVSKSGLKISIYEDKSGKITSAFPIHKRNKK